MRGKLQPLTRDMSGKYIVSLAVEGDPRELYDELRDSDVEIDIRKYHKRRSWEANAYFHVLVNKIAAALNESDTAVKKRIVQDYGVVSRDKEGNLIGFKLPISADVDEICEYTRWFDKREENGHWFNCYLAMKPTHLMDGKEMARVIEGAVTEAKELGIETLPPRELEAMIERFDYSRQQRMLRHRSNQES